MAAVGKQLDVLGKYAGVTRTNTGFAGQFTLSDDDFLSLIKMAIIRNNAGSSLAAIQGLIAQFFPGGEMLVFDYTNMQMSFMISEAIGTQNLVQAFVSEDLLPVPMGVSASVIYAPVVTMFFGCVTYEQPVAVNNEPLNTYENYHTDWPCMDYRYGVIVP